MKFKSLVSIALSVMLLVGCSNKKQTEQTTEEIVTELKNPLNQFDKLKQNGVYIHSNATPLGPFDPSYEPFVERFKEKNIEFVIASCSGHAHPKDLIKIINLIKPKLLVPIHSYKPEKLYNEHGERLLPKKKQTI